MSGSNALAAAKRRRGGSEPKGPSPPGSQRNVQNNSNVPSGSVPPGPLNPLQLVAFNHQRLNKLSDELPKSIDALGENFNALSSNCDYLHEQFTLLENKVKMALMNQSSNTSNVSVNSGGVDASKFEQLTKDVDEVHKVITRMQSFAMELSNSVSKTKEQFDTHVSSSKLSMNEFDTKLNLVEQKLNDRFDVLDEMLEHLIKSKNMDVGEDELEGEVEEAVE
jgi:chaperonin cofactor prefoldin